MTVEISRSLDLSISAPTLTRVLQSWEVPEQAVVEVSGPQLNATRSSFKRHLDTADQHIRDGRWDDVFTHLSLAIVDNPNYPRLYFMRGVAAISTARYESAVGDFSTVVKYNSVDKKLALVLRARIYRGMGRYDAAIGDYTLAYRSKPLNDPSDFSMLLLRGHCNAKLRNIPLAIADLTEAIQVRCRRRRRRRRHRNFAVACRSYCTIAHQHLSCCQPTNTCVNMCEFSCTCLCLFKQQMSPPDC